MYYEGEGEHSYNGIHVFGVLHAPDPIPCGNGASAVWRTSYFEQCLRTLGAIRRSTSLDTAFGSCYGGRQ